MNEVPHWDLSDLYQGLDDPQVESDLTTVSLKTKWFNETYRGKLADLSPVDFYQSLVELTQIVDMLSKLGTFAGLNRSTHETDTKVSAFCAKISDKLQPVYQDLIFYDLEIAQLSKDKVQHLMADEPMQKYAYYFHEQRKMQPHNLPEEIERLLSQKGQTGAPAFIRLYGEQKAAMQFDFDGKKQNETQMLALLKSPDASIRRRVGAEMVRGYDSQMLLFSRIYNTLLKDKQNRDEICHFETPMAAHYLVNGVTATEVQALVDTVIQNAALCVQPFYRLKAKMLGLDELTYWDRNASVESKSETIYTWQDAKEIVLSAYFDFDVRLGNIAQKFFDQNWIDAPVYDGKRSGAFASSGPASVHPYLLVNFMGKAGDVMTLAHEMGHGIHQYLSRSQGLMKGTSLNMAETASIFGEMLVFKYLMRQTTGMDEKISLMTKKMSDIINTSFRQIAFHRFEECIHRHRREQGELSPADFRNYFFRTQKEIVGDSIQMTESDGSVFAGIPHFVHTPFYVYSYAFADCLVNSLYRMYEERKFSDFNDKYITLLSAGGSQSPYDLLKPFGLDTTQANFWQKGLNVTKDLLAELQQLYHAQALVLKKS